MSIAALLKATKQHLITKLGLVDYQQIDIFDDGQPYPFVGELYYAIHPTSWAAARPWTNDTLEEEYGLSVTITRRSSVVPLDRRATELFLKNLTGMEALARKVIVAIHLDHGLMMLANSYMDGEEREFTPLWFQGADATPRAVDGSWFSAEPDKGSGLVLEVKFGGSQRFQSVFKTGAADIVE